MVCASADVSRLFGSLSMRPSMTRPRADPGSGGTGSEWRTACAVSTRVEPPNGRSPVTASYKEAPSENMSEAAVRVPDRITSGAMYGGLPATKVDPGSPHDVLDERPKSKRT